ncbi:MAG: NUDIX domain-containing protein [Bryobacterales bacterium]
MAVVSEEMLIDVVDDLDRATGLVAPRKEVLPRGLNFRVVHVFLFNRHGELLLQELGHSHGRHPGYWGSSVAGYLFSGERYEEAAARRLSQELGVGAVDLHFYSQTAMNDQSSKKFIALFVATYEGVLKPDPRLIERVEYLSPDAVWALLRNGGRLFTPTFRHLFEDYGRQRRKSG